MKRVFLIIDLDQTLADNEHRVHILPNWEAFHNACDKDTPIKPIIDIVQPLLSHPSVTSLFLTGRTDGESIVEKTKKWLAQEGLPGEIVFRRSKDFRKSHIFKKGVVDKYLDKFDAKDEYSVIILDDDEKIVSHFNEVGFTGVLVTPDNNYQDTISTFLSKINPMINDIELDNLTTHNQSTSKKSVLKI